MSRTGKVILFVIIWLAAIALAAQFDASIASWAKSTGCDAFLLSHRWLRAALRAPGVFWFTIPVAAALFFLHPQRWRAAVFLLLANGLIAVNDLLKWTIGRTRPYKLGDGGLHPFTLQPFRGGIARAFDVTNLSFPSGDAAVAFASAAALSILLPRWRWAFYTVALVVAAERVLEDAHWLSDTVGAAGYAIGGVYVLKWVLWERRGTAKDEA